MIDQAAELRNLVSQATRTSAPAGIAQPRLVVFSGAKGGVGVTTLVVNIAITMVDLGLRVVLVDADLYRADVAPLCNLPERGHVGDILSARRDIHEVLERGPGGILVVPGVWAPDHEIPFSQHSQDRLIRQIQSLGRHADVVLIDVGSASADAAYRFWMVAHEVVLVTTPDSVSVMDCYATIKTALAHQVVPETLRLIVNKTEAPAEADDVYRRINQSAGRFLRCQIGRLGSVPNDERVVRAASDATPAALSAAGGPAAVAMQTIASTLTSAAVNASQAAA